MCHTTHKGPTFQILELLAKESSLMRDRQVLSREVEFLRQQMVPTNDTDIDKQNLLYSSRHVAVQEIIDSVKQAEELSTHDLLNDDKAELDTPAAPLEDESPDIVLS